MINKLKIVGSGQKWSVSPCEPFYLLGTEPPAPDAALTGAKNLIEHYGLEGAYQKFCGRKLLDELAAFLPHISGNVNMPASEDGSGLLELVQQPPIRGKDLTPFAPSQLDHGFRLHPGPLPHEYMALFMAPPPTSNTVNSDSITTAAPGLASHSAFLAKTATCASSQPTQPPPFTNRGSGTPTNLRKRRRDVHRGASNSGSSGTNFPLNNTGGTPSSLGLLSVTPQTSSFQAVNPHSSIPSSVNTTGNSITRQLASSITSGPHSGPAPRQFSAGSRNDPMPNLQPSSSLAPQIQTSLPHPDIISSKSLSQLSSSLSPNSPAFPLQPQHSMVHASGNPSLGQTSVRNVRRVEDLSSEFTSSEISVPDDERRKKKRRDNRYKKDRE